MVGPRSDTPEQIVELRATGWMEFLGRQGEYRQIHVLQYSSIFNNWLVKANHTVGTPRVTLVDAKWCTIKIGLVQIVGRLPDMMASLLRFKSSGTAVALCFPHISANQLQSVGSSLKEGLICMLYLPCH